MVTEWNFADLWEAIADVQPQAPALLSPDLEIDWASFDRRADGVAATLLGAGLGEQEKVTQLLTNCPQYLESSFAAFKAGLVPVNTNHRYTPSEMQYLWENADVAAVVFHGSFTERCAEVRSRMPQIRSWLWVDDHTTQCPDWALRYSDVADHVSQDRVVAPWGRSGDNLLLLYTGGTTGMPKGVMWRQADVCRNLLSIGSKKFAEAWDIGELMANVTRPGPRYIPAAPLMHATGLFSAFSHLMVGGCVVTLAGRSFDPIVLLDAIDSYGINSLAIVGDTFAKPVVAELDNAPERWDISSLRTVISSGVMWSAQTKSGLLRHNFEADFGRHTWCERGDGGWIERYQVGLCPSNCDVSAWQKCSCTYRRRSRRGAREQ